VESKKSEKGLAEVWTNGAKVSLRIVDSSGKVIDKLEG
jgi:hypothetical protein